MKCSKYVILPDISLTGWVWVPGAVWFAWTWDVCPYETVELAERARRRKGAIARYSRTPTGSLGRLARLVFNASRLVCPSTVGLNKSKIDFILYSISILSTEQLPGIAERCFCRKRRRRYMCLQGKIQSNNLKYGWFHAGFMHFYTTILGLFTGLPSHP